MSGSRLPGMVRGPSLEFDSKMVSVPQDGPKGSGPTGPKVHGNYEAESTAVGGESTADTSKSKPADASKSKPISDAAPFGGHVPPYGGPPSRTMLAANSLQENNMLVQHGTNEYSDINPKNNNDSYLDDSYYASDYDTQGRRILDSSQKSLRERQRSSQVTENQKRQSQRKSQTSSNRRKRLTDRQMTTQMTVALSVNEQDKAKMDEIISNQLSRIKTAGWAFESADTFSRLRKRHEIRHARLQKEFGASVYHKSQQDSSWGNVAITSPLRTQRSYRLLTPEHLVKQWREWKKVELMSDMEITKSALQNPNWEAEATRRLQQYESQRLAVRIPFSGPRRWLKKIFGNDRDNDLEYIRMDLAHEILNFGVPEVDDAMMLALRDEEMMGQMGGGEEKVKTLGELFTEKLFTESTEQTFVAGKKTPSKEAVSVSKEAISVSKELENSKENPEKDAPTNSFLSVYELDRVFRPSFACLIEPRTFFIDHAFLAIAGSFTGCLALISRNLPQEGQADILWGRNFNDDENLNNWPTLLLCFCYSMLPTTLLAQSGVILVFQSEVVEEGNILEYLKIRFWQRKGKEFADNPDNRVNKSSPWTDIRVFLGVFAIIFVTFPLIPWPDYVYVLNHIMSFLFVGGFTFAFMVHRIACVLEVKKVPSWFIKAVGKAVKGASDKQLTMQPILVMVGLVFALREFLRIEKVQLEFSRIDESEALKEENEANSSFRYIYPSYTVQISVTIANFLLLSIEFLQVSLYTAINHAYIRDIYAVYDEFGRLKQLGPKVVCSSDESGLGEQTLNCEIEEHYDSSEQDSGSRARSTSRARGSRTEHGARGRKQSDSDSNNRNAAAFNMSMLGNTSMMGVGGGNSMLGNSKKAMMVRGNTLSIMPSVASTKHSAAAMSRKRSSLALTPRDSKASQSESRARGNALSSSMGTPKDRRLESNTGRSDRRSSGGQKTPTPPSGARGSGLRDIATMTSSNGNADPNDAYTVSQKLSEHNSDLNLKRALFPCGCGWKIIRDTHFSRFMDSTFTVLCFQSQALVQTCRQVCVLYELIEGKGKNRDHIKVLESQKFYDNLNQIEGGDNSDSYSDSSQDFFSSAYATALVLSFQTVISGVLLRSEWLYYYLSKKFNFALPSEVELCYNRLRMWSSYGVFIALFTIIVSRLLYFGFDTTVSLDPVIPQEFWGVCFILIASCVLEDYLVLKMPRPRWEILQEKHIDRILKSQKEEKMAWEKRMKEKCEAWSAELEQRDLEERNLKRDENDDYIDTTEEIHAEDADQAEKPMTTDNKSATPPKSTQPGIIPDSQRPIYERPEFLHLYEELQYSESLHPFAPEFLPHNYRYLNKAMTLICWSSFAQSYTIVFFVLPSLFMEKHMSNY